MEEIRTFTDSSENDATVTISYQVDKQTGLVTIVDIHTDVTNAVLIDTVPLRSSYTVTTKFGDITYSPRCEDTFNFQFKKSEETSATFLEIMFATIAVMPHTAKETSWSKDMNYGTIRMVQSRTEWSKSFFDDLAWRIEKRLSNSYRYRDNFKHYIYSLSCGLVEQNDLRYEMVRMLGQLIEDHEIYEELNRDYIAGLTI